MLVDNKKRIWISAYSDLYYSDDIGNSWHKIAYPTEIKGDRVCLARSLDNRWLFLSDDENMIYRTTARFDEWEYINSPILQTKETEYIPPVCKFGQVENLYIAKQNDKVFYTKADSIDWKEINNTTDFVITESSKIYLQNKDLSVFLANALMEIEWTSNDKLKNDFNLYCVNDDLYLFSSNFYYKINHNSFQQFPIYTDEHTIQPTNLSVKWKDQDISFDDGDVLMFDIAKQLWYRYMVLPIDFSYATNYNGQIILWDYDFNKYYTFNPDDKTYDDYILPKRLFDIADKKIESFRIEKGSEGCFHYHLKVEDYKKGGNLFRKVPMLNDAKRGTQPKSLSLNKKKDVHLIASLLKEIITTEKKLLSFTDLQITPKDIIAYKEYLRKKNEERIKEKNILEDKDELELLTLDIPPAEQYTIEEYLSVPDDEMAYERYEMLADSIEFISDSVLTTIFSLSTARMSTTTDWVKLSIKLTDNTIVSVSNEDTYPNYLHTTWEVDYEGLKFKTNSFRIGQLLNEIGENKIMDTIFTNKMYAIHQIVRGLYEEKIRKQSQLIGYFAIYHIGEEDKPIPYFIVKTNGDTTYRQITKQWDDIDELSKEFNMMEFRDKNIMDCDISVYSELKNILYKYNRNNIIEPNYDYGTFKIELEDNIDSLAFILHRSTYTKSFFNELEKITNDNLLEKASNRFSFYKNMQPVN